MGKIVKPNEQTRGPRSQQHNCKANADFPKDEQTADLPPGTVYECTETHGGKPCGRRWRLVPPVAAEWRAVRVITRRRSGTAPATAPAA